ncbi:MAG: hypothetical protein LBU84_16600 [Prevotella sp.]|nr:hypothetical protein [Prevotella sp.]
MINKLLCMLALFALISCSGRNVNIQTEDNNSMADDTIKENIVEESKVGERISGNFDGRSSDEYAYIVKVREGEGNPIDDDNAIAEEYAVRFSNKEIADLSIGCCDATLVFEGDLNGDGADEFSVFQAPMNGCVYHWMTYTYKSGEWKELFDMFLIPTGCEGLFDDERLLNMVFLRDGDVYYYERDINDENLGWIKVKAVLK